VLRTWELSKSQLKAEGWQAPRSPGWWLCPQGSDTHVPEGEPVQDGGAPHARGLAVHAL